VLADSPPLRISGQESGRINWLIEKSGLAASDLLRKMLDPNKTVTLRQFHALRDCRWPSPGIGRQSGNILFDAIRRRAWSSEDPIVMSSLPRHDLLILLSSNLSQADLIRVAELAVLSAKKDLSSKLLELNQKIDPHVGPNPSNLVSWIFESAQLADIYPKLSGDQEEEICGKIRHCVEAMIWKNSGGNPRPASSVDCVFCNITEDLLVEDPGYRNPVHSQNILETARISRDWLIGCSSAAEALNMLESLDESIRCLDRPRQIAAPPPSTSARVRFASSSNFNLKVSIGVGEAVVSPADYLFRHALGGILPAHLRPSS